jgi:hypothetical protein
MEAKKYWTKEVEMSQELRQERENDIRTEAI